MKYGIVIACCDLCPRVVVCLRIWWSGDFWYKSSNADEGNSTVTPFDGWIGWWLMGDGEGVKTVDGDEFED